MGNFREGKTGRAGIVCFLLLLVTANITVTGPIPAMPPMMLALLGALLGTIAVLILGVLLVNPELRAPSFSTFTAGGGPIVPGRLFPFVFEKAT